MDVIVPQQKQKSPIGLQANRAPEFDAALAVFIKRPQADLQIGALQVYCPGAECQMRQT